MFASSFRSDASSKPNLSRSAFVPGKTVSTGDAGFDEVFPADFAVLGVVQ